jgi:hypothetical protein
MRIIGYTSILLGLIVSWNVVFTDFVRKHKVFPAPEVQLDIQNIIYQSNNSQFLPIFYSRLNVSTDLSTKMLGEGMEIIKLALETNPQLDIVSKPPSYKSIDEIITGHQSNDIQIVSNNAFVADFDVYNKSLQNLEDGLDFEVTFTSPNLSNLETDFASSENFKPFQNMELNGDQETNDHAVNLMASSFPFITEVKNAHLSIIFESNNMDFLDELPPHITQKNKNLITSLRPKMRPSLPEKQLYIAVGYYKDPENILKVEKHIGLTGYNIMRTFITTGNVTGQQIIVGPFTQNLQISKALEIIRILGYEDAYVSKM